MKISRKKMIFIVGVMSIALLAFSTVLNVMSFRKMQAETYVHAENLNTVSIVRKINYAISFGKPLDKFYGLDRLLEEVDELSENILGLDVMDTDGKSVKSTGAVAKLPEWDGSEEYMIRQDGIYSFISFDAGTIVLYLDSSVVEQATWDYVRSILYLDILLFAGILCVLGLSCLVWSKGGISVKRLKVTSLVLLIVAQILFGTISTKNAITSFQDSVEQIAHTASQVVRSDIDEVLAKGIHYDELRKVDEYLENLGTDIPELSSIQVADQASFGEDIRDYGLRLKNTNREIHVVCQMNRKLIQNKILNNVIDILILVMVTIFISLETIGFITQHLEQRSNRIKGELYFPAFRLFVFLSGISFSLDCGFISILSNRLYEKMEMPSQFSFLGGLPNTMYSVAIVLGLFSCSFLITRLGMKKTMMLGISMGIVGYLLCAAAVSLPYLIVARFVFGFCDGLVINAIRLYASSQNDKEVYNKILVTYLAAINLGVCCSVVIGGLVADVTSYTIVFLLGAVLGIICFGLVQFVGFPNTKKGGHMSFWGALKELHIGKVFRFMLFIVIPIYVATLYVGYSFPLFGDEIGFSNSFISGCLMMNYLIIAYLTDPISDWVNRHIQPQKAIVCYVVLQAISIGIFVIFANVWIAILALILTSLWDCFGMVAIDSVLDDVKETSKEKNTLLQMIFGKIGMIVGPMLVTARLSQGAASATGSIVFLLLVGVLLYVVLGIVENISTKERRSA